MSQFYARPKNLWQIKKGWQLLPDSKVECLSLSASTALAKSDKYQCVALSQPIEKVPKELTNGKPKGGWLSSDRVVGVGPTPIPNETIENSSPQAKLGVF